MCLQITNRVPQVHKFGPFGEHDDRLVDLGYTLYLTILVMIFGDLLSRQLSQRTHIRRENCFFNSSLAGFPESSYVQAGTHRKQAPNMVDFDRTLHIRGFLSALINWIEMVRKGWERPSSLFHGMVGHPYNHSFLWIQASIFECPLPVSKLLCPGTQTDF